MIVFKPLSSDAMRGITRCVLADIQQSWLDRRQRRLEVDEAIVDSIAEIAQKKNEDSKGKEGDRIVCKLFVDFVEAKIQESISKSPADYKSCKAVRVSLVSHHEQDEVPECKVCFRLE